MHSLKVCGDNAWGNSCNLTIMDSPGGGVAQNSGSGLCGMVLLEQLMLCSTLTADILCGICPSLSSKILPHACASVETMLICVVVK